FPTLAAEDLSARYLDVYPSPDLPGTFRLADLPDMWLCASPSRRVLALFSTSSLRAKLESLIRETESPAGVSVTVVGPGEDALTRETIAPSSLGSLLPGWRLALSLDDRTLFDT